MRLTTRLPSPALTVSIAALVVALGGTSYAAGLIGSRDIENNSIRSQDIKDKTIKSSDLEKGGVKSSDVLDGTLQTQDFKAGQVPKGPQGPAGVGRWALVNAAGQIEAQSGGFTVTVGYPAAPAAANGNVYINANEPLTNNGILATIALQNTVDQSTPPDGISNGTSALADSNPEFSGEIAVSRCAPTGTFVTNCAPAGTNNVNTLVVSPRNSDGTRTADGSRKRFYVVVTGDSSDYVAP